MTDTSQDVAVTSPTWNSQWCHCWQIKGCGLVPCCLPNTICFMPCMWANATSQIKGLEEWGRYSKCCPAVTFCPCCTFYVSFKKLSKHYNIKQPSEAELVSARVHTQPAPEPAAPEPAPAPALTIAPSSPRPVSP